MSLHTRYHCPACGHTLSSILTQDHGSMCRNKDCPLCGFSCTAFHESRRQFSIKYIPTPRLNRLFERPTTDCSQPDSSASFLSGSNATPVINSSVHCTICGQTMTAHRDDMHITYACNNPNCQVDTASFAHFYRLNNLHELEFKYYINSY